MIDLYLRAESEVALAAALPMLRADDETGAEYWIAGGLHHALDAGFAVIETPAVFGQDGALTSPAVLAPGYHANLRLLDGHPDHAEIVAAAEPYAVTPLSPQRRFAGGPPAAVVPSAISGRQFAQVLALDGVISEDEALAWASNGTLPDAMETALQAIPEDGEQRFAAKMLLSSATVYERAHPLVPVLGQLLGYDAAALDDIWRRAAAF